MADIITRLKVESSEYDQKLSRAVSSLNQMSAEAAKAGNSIAAYNDKNVALARSLGNMQTVATSAKGKIGEMTKAFQDASVVYKNLTDAEKKSPFGVELAKSLATLKGRITEAKGKLEETNRELKGTTASSSEAGGGLSDLAGKFGINTKALTTLGVALGAGATAFKVLQGAMESIELTHDEFQRITSVSEAVTNSFLTCLANADFSNFISGLDTVAQHAIDAYNALDDLGSYQVRLDPWDSAVTAKIQTLIKQARAAKAKGDKEAAQKYLNDAKALAGEEKGNIIEGGRKKEKAGFADFRALMGNVEITDDQIRWYANPANYNKASQMSAKYAEMKQRANRIQTMSTGFGGYYNINLADEEAQKWIKSKEAERYRRAYTVMNLRDGSDTERGKRLIAALSNIHGMTLAISQTESVDAQIERFEGMLSGGGSAGGGGGHRTYTPRRPTFTPRHTGTNTFSEREYTANATNRLQFAPEEPEKQIYISMLKGVQQKSLNEWAQENAKRMTSFDMDFSALPIFQGNKYADLSNGDKLRSIDSSLFSGLTNKATDIGAEGAYQLIDAFYAKLKDGFDIPDDAWQSLVDKINEKCKELGIDPIKINLETGDIETVKKSTKSTVDTAKGLAECFNNASSAVSSFGKESEGAAKSAAVLTFAGTVASLMSSMAEKMHTTVTIWDWIAGGLAATAALGTMVNTMKTINKGSFAEGGMVPGNPTGDGHDNTFVYASPGEIILNRAQQSNIASQLSMSGGGGGGSTPYTTGEKIYLGLQAYGRRSGKGELVFAH